MSHQIRIVFQGVCTHFTDNTVPDVPHRVVLTDASAMRFGIVNVAGGNNASYFLMPHFAILRSTDASIQDALSLTNVIHHGNVIDGVSLRIENAIGPLTYDEQFFTFVPQITNFVQQYTPSADVIEGRNATAYFDLFSGSVTKEALADQAIAVVVNVETDGPPILLATPFDESIAPQQIPLGNDLLVANQGMDCHTTENHLDFLLHYLTARAGIPRKLTQPTPGMTTLASFTRVTLDAALLNLSTLDFPNHFHGPCFEFTDLFEKIKPRELVLSLACSDTRYP
jgi:hypothetical protein